MTEFSASSSAVQPWGITVGSDGNLWFTEYSGSNVGRITTAGVVTQFPITGMHGRDIVSGADGALWFIDPQGSTYNVGRMTTAGAFTGMLMTYGTPYGITPGPDGNVWVTAQVNGGTSSVVRITPAGVQTHFPDTNPSTLTGFTLGAYAIASGSDGNLWFTHGSIEGSQGQIASINPTTGVISEHAISANMTGLAIVSDPTDGELWFTNGGSGGVGLNRITTAGVLTTSSAYIDGIPPITIGPDGNVWSIDQGSGNLYDYAENFGLTSYAGTTNNSLGYAYNYSGLVTGPDGNVWFTESQFTKIGRLNTAGILSHGRRRSALPARH